MLLCPKCGCDESFTQIAGTFRRNIRIVSERGSIRAQKSPWRHDSTIGSPIEGVSCEKCSGQVPVSAKLLSALQLDDRPVEGRAEIDLDQLLKQIHTVARDAAVEVEEQPIAHAKYRDFNELNVPIPEALRVGLTDRLGVPLNHIYEHQLQSLAHFFARKNVVLQTPTASGKSLCYLIPIFRKLLTDQNATALFLFPTKALAFDQRKKIAQISEDFDAYRMAEELVWPLKFGNQTVWMGSYERETRDRDQEDVKEKCRIVTTNPDSLHMKMLPHLVTSTGSWERFFKNLVFVVCDEIHVYRGVFGANVAYVLRRLRMLCEQLGNSPQFFCSSATLPDPKMHAETLVGLPFEAVTTSGAPRHRKAIVLWNPGMQKRSESDEGDRREPTTDAIELVSHALLKRNPPVQTITFIRSLAGVEKFNLTLSKRLRSEGNPFADKTRAFKSTILLKEKNEIVEGLMSGQVVHVTSTNALELGIDIGDLGACVLVGYPGTVSSFLQQAGRVGRKGTSLVALLLKDEPLEQYFARNPKHFFELIRRVEPIKLPIANPHVMAQQAMCAAWDLRPDKKKKFVRGLTEPIFIKYFGAEGREKVQKLLAERQMSMPEFRGSDQSFWVVNDSCHHDDVYQNIRVPISVGKFSVLDESKTIIGECDSTIVPRDLFPGAVWLNNGRPYLSKAIRYQDQVVEVKTLRDESLDYLTIAMPETTLSCDQKNAKQRESDGFMIGAGTVTVHRKVERFLEVPVGIESKFQERARKTNTDPIEFDSTAFWIEFTPEIITRCGVEQKDAHGAIHALEHVLRSVFPLVADVDPGDVGSTTDVGEINGSERLYIFDSFAGGTGLADFAYLHPKKLVEAATDLLSSCPCKDPAGCPRCTILSWCEVRNEGLSKSGALQLLGGLKGMK